MLNHRRMIYTTGLGLVLLFLLFHTHSSKNIHGGSFLQGSTTLEEDLLRNKQTSDDAFRDLQKETHLKAELKDEKLKLLEQERQILDKELEQLKRLPHDTPVSSQLAFQFPYEANSRFPASIWQTWKRSPEDPEFDRRFRLAVNSWDERNPGFVHEVMSDDIAHAVVQHLYMNVPRVIEAYEALPEDILRADFFRYLILLARGGIYTDVDTQALQPVPNWIPDTIDPSTIGLIVGIEADPDREDWADWYARRIQFCQWTIQSKRGHPVLRDIVSKITDYTLQRKNTNTLELPFTKERGSQIMDWTGPGIWTDSVFQYFNDESHLDEPVSWHNFTGLTDAYKVSDVMVLPITSFSPGVGTMGSRSTSHPMAYVKHNFAGSWKPAGERMR